ncbi:TGS domain-containing protein, partial [bacterium]|nr:TGS domain-containing protein [bacterium]
MSDYIKIKLPDGSEKEFEKGASAYDVALSISEGLARNSVAAKVDGRIMDLNYPLEGGENLQILTWKSEESHEILLHSTAHIMAQAVKNLFPKTKVTIGPALEDRFYYDFDVEKPLTDEDLSTIETEMKKIIAAKYPVKRVELPRNEAIKQFQDMDEFYKVEIISDIPEDEIVSVYSQGDFSDLCRGPHLPHTGMVPAFKLLSVAGAYWRGDQNNKQLSRIYGTAFPSKKELKQYLFRLEEAKKRDHRKLGRDLDLFEINEQVGPGLVLWYPKGAILRKSIEDYWHWEHRRKGYQPVVSPHLGKSTLWETSGHL